MPYGGTTPEQDRKIESCVAELMGDSDFKKKYEDPEERKGRAIAICKSRIMGEGCEKVIKEDLRFNFTTPIQEAYSEGDKDSVKIKGTMITAGESRNNRTYTFEELQKARFSGNTLSVNHTESVTDNVGFFEPKLVDSGYEFEGVVYNTPYHPGIVEMIKKGLVKFVSIEAIAGNVVKEGENYVVKDLDFTGLGLVKTPGCENAHLAVAEAFEKEGYYAVKKSETSDNKPKYPINNCADVEDAWKLRKHGDYNISLETLEKRIKARAKALGCEIPGEKEEYQNQKEVENMPEEEKPQVEEPKEEEKQEEPKEEKQEEPKVDEETKEKVNGLEKQIAELSEQIKKLNEKKSKGIVTKEQKEPTLKIQSKKTKNGVDFWSEELKY
jgi:hypothetical protein